MPGTYPPRPLNGVMVSCFLTPSLEQQHTYPPPLRREVERVVGEYLFDCTNFRTDDKANLLEQIYTMTDRRFKLADHFLRTKPWDLFAMVEIGVDRIHHAFWKDLDPQHRRYDPNGQYANAIREYYDHVDRRSPGSSSTPTRTPSSSSSPTTARSAWTAASGSTSGCAARACWRRRSEPTDGASSPTSASTGAAPSPGARAATTRGSS